MLQEVAKRGSDPRSSQRDGAFPVQTALEGMLLAIGFTKPPLKGDLNDPEKLYKGQYYGAVI
jgi:hypothetical protein